MTKIHVEPFAFFGSKDAARRQTFTFASCAKASAIAPEVARERGYRTVTIKAELKRLGFSDQQRCVPALLLPVHGVGGEVVNYQVRPHEPRVVHGKLVKYETPRGSGMAVDVPPRARARIGDPSHPLFITEGIRTDPLMLGPIRVAQLVSVLCVALAVVLVPLLLRRARPA